MQKQVKLEADHKKALYFEPVYTAQTVYTAAHSKKFYSGLNRNFVIID